MIYSDNSFFSCLSDFFSAFEIAVNKGNNPILTHHTGLKDANGKGIYENDILQFDNGDRFFINCEEWLELFVDWIGEPECEDQARDFYRIERAKIIGNTFQNPELLNEPQNANSGID